MRLLIYIMVFLSSASIASAQSWRDSLQLGKQYYKEGNYQRAYQTLLKAQEITPNDVDLSQDIGNAAYRSGDYKMAEKAFKSAVSNEDNKDVKSKHWHNVGNSQMKEKDYQAAIESYKNALHLNPEDDKTRYNLAEAKRRVKQQQQKQKQNQQQQNQNKDNNQKDNKSDQSAGNNKQLEQNKGQNQEKNQQSGTNDSDPSKESEGKLSDRKSDRMLEDLLKDEMQTKRKVRGAESSNDKNQSKSDKRW